MLAMVVVIAYRVFEITQSSRVVALLPRSQAVGSTKLKTNYVKKGQFAEAFLHGTSAGLACREGGGVHATLHEGN